MSDRKQFKFDGELYRTAQGTYYIDFPFDVFETIGTRRQVPVKVWFDGYFERKSLLPKGGGKHWLTISSTVRNAIGKIDGDLVSVVLELDTDTRSVKMPDDLLWLFDNEPDVKERFMKRVPNRDEFHTIP